MKRFELIVECEGEKVQMSAKNDGFSAFELIAVLETKKSDLVEQVTHPENFTHHRIAKEKGKWKNIAKRCREE